MGGIHRKGDGKGTRSKVTLVIFRVEKKEVINDFWRDKAVYFDVIQQQVCECLFIHSAQGAFYIHGKSGNKCCVCGCSTYLCTFRSGCMPQTWHKIVLYGPHDTSLAL